MIRIRHSHSNVQSFAFSLAVQHLPIGMEPRQRRSVFGRQVDAAHSALRRQLVAHHALEIADTSTGQSGYEDHIIPADRRFLNIRSEEHTSELQSLMRISYAVFCLKIKNTIT